MRLLIDLISSYKFVNLIMMWSKDKRYIFSLFLYFSLMFTFPPIPAHFVIESIILIYFAKYSIYYCLFGCTFVLIYFPSSTLFYFKNSILRILNFKILFSFFIVFHHKALLNPTFVLLKINFQFSNINDPNSIPNEDFRTSLDVNKR